MSGWNDGVEQGSAHSTPVLLWLGVAGVLLLLLGIVTPWISPRRDFDYQANKQWFTDQLQRLDNVEEARPIADALGCSLPCNLDAEVATSLWSPLDERFTAGGTIAGWQLLGGRFHPAGALRAMVIISLLLLMVTTAWVATGGRFAPHLLAVVLGLSAFTGLTLSVFQLPKVDTLGYDHHFLLSLLSTLAGSHQGWGLWFILAGYLVSLVLAVSIAVSTTVEAPVEGGWNV